MGSHTWVRDDKHGGGGKTHVAGVAAVVPPQPPPSKKRKLVWQRPEPTEDDIKGEAEPSAAVATKPVEAAQQKSARPASPSGAQSTKLQELEALRRQIEERKRALQQSAAASKAAAAAEQQSKEAEREARRRKLEAGFSSAFAAAKDAADADIAASKTPVAFADSAEVERVLGAGSDYGVLRLAPGADASTVRRRYREMAVQLHPDKCKVERAAEAFHRLVQAYQQLAKYALRK